MATSFPRRRRRRAAAPRTAGAVAGAAEGGGGATAAARGAAEARGGVERLGAEETRVFARQGHSLVRQVRNEKWNEQKNSLKENHGE